MNKTDIKNVLGKLTPDEEMEQRLSEKILKRQHKRFPARGMVSIAASLLIVVSLGVIGYTFGDKKAAAPRDIIGSITGKNSNSPGNAGSAGGIDIPKIELPKDTNGSAADMIGLIVYQGKIYTQCGTRIDTESAEKLKGEKLGTTKGNIDEWSSQDDYAVEFASTTGKADVYTVNGYDKDFRIMTYAKIDGAVYAGFYECLNGITVNTGADVFGRLKMDGNIKSAKQEKFDSWNYNKQEYQEIKNLDGLKSFVSKLNDTKPYTQESMSYLFDNQTDTNVKIVYVALNDGSEVELRFFKDGYIYYGYSHIFFKMEDETFNKLWNELGQSNN